MGELGGVDGNRTARLTYATREEIERVMAGVPERAERTLLFADLNRLNTLYMIMKAGSGHLGTSFSAMEIASWIWLHELENPNQPDSAHSDLYFSSKGHDAPGLYSILISLGKLPFDKIHALRRLGGLPGHPDTTLTPYVVTNTGSLGMGVSKARGIALARRMLGRTGRIYVMTGDGEIQEGQFWESLQPTANRELAEITVIIDHNRIQSDTWVKDVSDLGDLAAKLASFGWAVDRVDGHDPTGLGAALARARQETVRPQVIIADTVKGKGVSFMERVGEDGRYRFHSGAPSTDDYLRAADEILERLNARLGARGIDPIATVETDLPERVVPAGAERLIAAYGEELAALGSTHAEIVALDADLAVDTGQVPFRDAFPDRFIEAGIAEQDMVSMAGGLALQGMLPVLHSFACFMMPRANEQIYNNATEGRKIIYVASLAGLLPGGPGHSHQSVRDIAICGANPGLTILEPSTESEARLALRWAVEENAGSTFIRLVSIPVVVPFRVPDGYRLKRGAGLVLRDGVDALLIAYGPVMLAEVMKAAGELAAEQISLGIVNLPWLNVVDPAWLGPAVRPYPLVIAIDNHYTTFGQGSVIATALARMAEPRPRFAQFGVDEIPACGANAEVLAHHGLDAAGLATRIRTLLSAPLEFHPAR